MTSDPDKGAQYGYNAFGMPSLVKVPAILGTIDYKYSATGERFEASYKWHSGLSLDPLENVNRPTYTATNSSKLRQYVGNKVYENGSLKRILFDNGCIEGGIYYFYLRDHLGNNSVVAKADGQVVQRNHYYPYGKTIGNGESWGQAAQPYKFGGKEEETMFGLELYDFHARQMDRRIPGFLGVDPLAEKYYSISPYVYCAGNPVRFVDPDGREIDLSGMSEDQRKRYESQILTQRENSKLFNAMYSSLENSKDVYHIQYGKTTTINDATEAVEGQFVSNKDGGGTVTFSDAMADIKGGILSEELFHAYQYDSRAGYADGDFNVEFEAKVAITAIGNEYGGFGAIQGAEDFQNKITYGDYGDGVMVITPQNVVSSSFNSDYKNAANSYSKYNRDNNIGNSHYLKNTTVAPYSLQQMIIKAYGK